MKKALLGMLVVAALVVAIVTVAEAAPRTSGYYVAADHSIAYQFDQDADGNYKIRAMWVNMGEDSDGAIIWWKIPISWSATCTNWADGVGGQFYDDDGGDLRVSCIETVTGSQMVIQGPLEIGLGIPGVTCNWYACLP